MSHAMVEYPIMENTGMIMATIYFTMFIIKTYKMQGNGAKMAARTLCDSAKPAPWCCHQGF